MNRGSKTITILSAMSLFGKVKYATQRSFRRLVAPGGSRQEPRIETIRRREYLPVLFDFDISLR